MSGARNHGFPGADHAGFLSGDGGVRGSEVLSVIEFHVGDHGYFRFHRVGGVQAAAHADLEHREIDRRTGKMHKAGGGEKLKEAGVLVESSASPQSRDYAFHFAEGEREVIVAD